MTSFNDMIKRAFYTPEISHFFEYSKLEFGSMKKFEILNDYINNVFFSDEYKKIILDIFCKIQQLVHSVIRLKRSWIFKRARLYNSEDLFMTPIQDGDKNVFIIVQNKMKYVFHIRELIQSIQVSLSNCNHFFPEPILCKNPYTNIPFNKSTLYNIYFAIRRSNYKMPELFHRFFLNNFNFNHFSLENEELINDEYLNSYVSNHCFDIYNLCYEMFYYNNVRFNIHKDFPKDLLMKAMNPYLTLYVFSQYSLNQRKKMRSQRILHMKLHNFVDYNSNFGRKKVHLISKNPFSCLRYCKYFFDEKYLPFYENDENFMNSHLDIEVERPPIQLHMGDLVYRSQRIHPTPLYTENGDPDEEDSYEEYPEDDSDEDQDDADNEADEEDADEPDEEDADEADDADEEDAEEDADPN